MSAWASDVPPSRQAHNKKGLRTVSPPQPLVLCLRSTK